MTIIEPIPDLQWGRGDWQDYISNWREKDAEYLQARSILRYQTAAARTADWPSPQAGHVIYNHETQSLEMWRTSANAWVRSLMFQYLTATQDSTAGVKMVHASAGGKGILITPTNLVIDQPLNVMGGMLQVDTTFVGVQSLSQKLAKLTTDSDELLSDTPLAAPAIRLTGTGTVVSTAGNITMGTLTSGAITASGAITTTGNVQANTVNASTGTLGGIGMSGNIITAPAGSGNASAAGFQSGQGYFYGDSNSAVMRQRSSAGVAAGAPFVQATSDRINIGGTGPHFMDVYPTMRLFGGRGIHWINSGGTHQAWISPVIVQASDPGAGNFPDGTIWIQP